MNRWRAFAGTATAALAVLFGTGCSTAGLLLTAVGASTDTSVTWDVVKHLHAQLTEGDARPCSLLTSVQRALSARCGAFRPGSIVAAELERTGLAECPLTLAARDPLLWAALPELIEKGARLEACTESPVVALAQRLPCPDFVAAPSAVRGALVQLAVTDPRAVHHDAVRMLTCPGARAAGLDAVIATWRGAGRLAPRTLGFSPLGALDPVALATTTLGADLEADGHTAREALGGYDGALRPGFEEALRTSQWGALEWWLARLPELAQRVPPTQGNQLSWLPLARVLVPSFLANPETQNDMVGFLLARGASPRQRLPSNPDQTVLAFARQMKSPMLSLLDPAPAVPTTERLAASKAPLPAE